MQSLWKKLFIIVAVLLVISLTLSSGLWYQLEGVKSQLSITEAQLETAKTELGTTKLQLDITKTELGAAKLQLDITKTELGDTKLQLDTTRTQLIATKAELDITRTQLDTVKSELNQMLDRYSDLRKQINMRLGSGQDCQNFITPNDPVISSKVREITGGYSQDVNEYWRDFERLYRWVIKNIKYAEDSYTPVFPEVMDGTLTWRHGFWRMPAETVEDKAGDCEDMATLLASMLLNYTEERFTFWCVGIYTASPEYTGHIAVAFPVKDNKLTILDPAGNYYTAYPASLTADDVTVATNRWLSHWRKDMPDAQIYAVFSHKFYREFSSTQEFIDWVRER